MPAASARSRSPSSKRSSSSTAPKCRQKRRTRYVLVFTTPGRDGELSGVRLRYLHLDAPVPYVEIDMAVAMLGDEGYATLRVPKTEYTQRKLPLHPMAVEAIKEWLEVGWPALVGRAPGPDDFLFPRRDGAPQRPRSADRFRQDLAAAGLTATVNGVSLVFHDTRNIATAWMTEAGVPDSLIDRFLGHAPSNVTDGSYRSDEQLLVMYDAVRRIGLRWSRGVG